MKKLTHISTVFFLALLISPITKSHAQPPCTNNWIQYVEMDSGSHVSFATTGMAITHNHDVFLGYSFLGKLSVSNVFQLSGTGTTGAFSDIGLIGLANQGDAMWGVQSYYQPHLSQATITTDKNNHILLVGHSYDSTMQLSGKTLKFPTKRGVYLARYSSDSLLLELIPLAYSTAGGISLSIEIITDDNNNIYMYGMFTGTITFDTITVSASSISHIDLFLVKYNSAGEVQWVTNSGNNPSFVMPRGITNDEHGNLIGVAAFAGDLNLYGKEVRYRGFANATDGLIVKWDSSGNYVWSKSVTTLGGADAYNVKAHGSDFYLSGSFGRFLIYGNDTLIKNNGGSNSFIMKLDSDGESLWVNTSSSAYAPRISVFKDGRVIAVTSFSDTAVFYGQQLVSIGQENACISILSPNGGLEKNIHVKSSSFVNLYEVATLPNNDIYLSGVLTDNAQIVNRQVNFPSKQKLFVMRTCVDNLLKANTPLQRKLTAQDMRVKVFPNPTNNNLFMELAANDDYEITVSDISGRVQLRESYSTRGHSTTFELNCSTLSNGMYFIRVNSKKSFSGYAKFYKN